MLSFDSLCCEGTTALDLENADNIVQVQAAHAQYHELFGP
jgi:hypothetical protein